MSALGLPFFVSAAVTNAKARRPLLPLRDPLGSEPVAAQRKALASGIRRGIFHSTASSPGRALPRNAHLAPVSFFSTPVNMAKVPTHFSSSWPWF
eukprot:4239103-Pleurochrysis_carterae.AAC.1